MEATFAFNSPTAENVVKVCVDWSRSRLNGGNVKLNGRDVSVKHAVHEALGRSHFELENGEFKVTWCGVRNFDHSLLTVEDSLELDARDLLHRLAMHGALVCGRLFDEEYDHWQNAEDPLEYEVAGRSMVGLPLKSNGLPAPLDQMIVDVSRNPGRRVLRTGYVEAIGHRMWLGAEFFRRVPGAAREAITAASWLQATELPGGTVELLAQEHPFRDESTAELQDRLRALLFPKS